MAGGDHVEYGSTVTGGDAGTVLHVTTLADSGAGSLREAIAASGARKIVFDVSGTIELDSRLTVSNGSITIDGSTAPDKGICLKSYGIAIAASQVKLRYIRIRPGPNAEPSTNDCIQISNAGVNVMIEHCSLSWSQDEIIDISGSNVCIRYNILSEALSNSGHPDGEHSKAIFNINGGTDISMHHNLLAHNNDRNPTVQCGNFQMYNNALYNFSWFWVAAYDGPVRLDCVNNYFKAGADTQVGREHKYAMRVKEGTPYYDSSRIFFYGNNALAPLESYAYSEAAPCLRSTPTLETNVTVSADDALSDVLTNAGAILPARDAVDDRIAADVVAGTGTIIDDPSEVGGWPDLGV